jgi:type I restriction enzyme S subunit
MGPFGANIKVETFVNDGIPIISGQHLKVTLVEDNEYNFITVSHAQKLKNSLVYSGDVIFTHAGNIGQVAYLHSASRYKEYILSQRQFYLRPNNEQASGLFLTLFFKSSIGQYRLLANTSSTGVPSISRPVTNLRSIKVIISTNDIMNQFTEVVMSMYNDISSNFRENKSLSELRDTLLPKLISGELEINEISN